MLRMVCEIAAFLPPSGTRRDAVARLRQSRASIMRKMLCEIDLEKAQRYPGRYLEHFPTMNRAPAYAEFRESIVEVGVGPCDFLHKMP